MSSAADPSPLSLVIFGASGDLTGHKLIPALFQLFAKHRLPANTRIVGVARSPYSDDQFRDRLAPLAEKSAGKEWNRDGWNTFAQHVFYVSADAAKPGGLAPLQKWLADKEGNGKAHRLYYMAVGPDLYPGIATQLGENGMAGEEHGWRRLVVEKPFGRDLATAKELNRLLHRYFDEDQIYRIDHYLGKETVQNLLVFRFANTIFEPVWNHQFIDHVQITVGETVPVGSRGPYYDRAGVLRDMIQSHLLQVMTLVTMEAPSRFDARALRNEKLKVLESVPVLRVEDAATNVVGGQYEGYLKENGVAADSRTPTWAAVRLHIDNWRWRGVPIYLRSGKGLAKRYTEVIVQFHCPPHMMFPLPADTLLQCNQLGLCIQPDEGIHLNFQTKVPDTEGVVLRPADLQFHYRDAYADVVIPDAYERLLQDAIHGDASLFMRSDGIERAWEIMDPYIAALERPEAPQLQSYPVGSQGPKSADEFIARDGRKWLIRCH
ncbi:MAG: glucose-6-phosphate dehydrogenase [Gemmataceae bacterium]|nr:glucose-6-phosphate dehydrogenase [Gemmataceae bacterium]